jgi:hypothetical protein
MRFTEFVRKSAFSLVVGTRRGKTVPAWTSSLNSSSDQIDFSIQDLLLFNGANKVEKLLEGLANAQTKCIWSRAAALAALGSMQRLPWAGAFNALKLLQNGYIVHPPFPGGPPFLESNFLRDDQALSWYFHTATSWYFVRRCTAAAINSRNPRSGSVAGRHLEFRCAWANGLGTPHVSP